MGLNFFTSSSSYDTPTWTPPQTQPQPLPNPDPKNYNIEEIYLSGNCFVLKVRYPDCTNYEGRKILVYAHKSLEKLLAQKSIDPHFSNNNNFISPFARFEPTKAGWKKAVELVEILNKN